MIPNDFIQTLLSRVDVVEVVEKYLPLKKAGANYMACCPFHGEKTPSFTVSPSKQFYHCFGCGAHGTAISFLMEHTGCGFIDAVQELANMAGLTVPHQSSLQSESSPATQGPSLHEILLIAAKFYRQQLKGSTRAIDYLKQRGLTGEIAAKFGIGYAPMGWQALDQAYPDYTDATLEAAGLVIAGDAGKRYDRFRDRVMFPIHDVQGRIIGFGGRVLDGGEPKYLNSPETAVFSKGRELYGLFQARSAIRAAAKVLVVEGYMDVVALAQHGIEYAVATLGTATTPAHVQKLFRQTDRIVFCFDGDAAGQRAAWRALENALPVLADGKRIDFLFLPPEHDPDSFVRAHGTDSFERLLASAVPLSNYLVRELASRHSPASAEGRAALLTAARELLGRLTAPVLGTLLRKDLAEAVGLTAQEVGGLLPGPALGRTVRGHAPTRNSNRLSATRKAICMLLSNPALGRGYADLEPIAGEPEAAALRELLAVINADSTPAELNTATLLELFRDNPHLGVLKEANARNLDLNDSFGEADWQLQVEHLRSESRKLQAQQMYQNRSVADLKNDKSDLVRFGGRLPAGNIAAPGLLASEPDVPTTA